ncbi:putative pectinesterase/pectinesterase inhibitor 28 [Aristolochia californica]|uniref:putative pectinesterase/pectinesterase inhibitor 28 n=1 Tax=Aristolochia californica TaxID=171875 RepID=UPI0035E36CE8
MGSLNGYGSERKGGNLGKKIILGGVSVMLVVAVVVAVVTVINRHKTSDGFPSNGNNGGISTSSKAVSTICAPTDYRESCESVLNQASKNNGDSTDPKVLVKAAFQATLDELKSVFNLSTVLGKKESDTMTKMALSDCEDLMQSAIQELQASFSAVGDKELHTFSDRVDDIKNWLSAVLSYQQACMDGVPHPEVKSAISDGMINATQLTSNALAIVSEISSILSTFNIPINFNPNKRKLLENDRGLHDMDEKGFPTWLSAADRKLLAYRDTQKLRPNVVVAQDGSGKYKTINDALKNIPKSRSGRFIIYVKAGIYREQVLIDNDMENIFMYGDGPRRTVVTASKNFVDGTPTYQTATFAAEGNGFICKSMGFRNTAGPEKHQAVALRVKSDMSAFYNCRMDAYQDTLYVQTHRQFYRNCIISGTVDFIFGDSAVVIQNSKLIVRKPMANQQNIVTAQGRTDKREPTGIVIHNCRIVPETKLYSSRFATKTYLGRPWKEYSRTIIMESTIADFIQSDGYMPWDGDFALKTLYYAEYANRGPGARTNRRVKWPGVKVISRREALQYTVGSFINGKSWLPSTGAPYMLGLRA